MSPQETYSLVHGVLKIKMILFYNIFINSGYIFINALA